MKNKYALLAWLVLLGAGLAAQTQQVELNQLLAPSSPAFNLLGISPEVIERPTNPTDFALSLNNASHNLSIIPSNYAIELAPFWMLNGKNMRWEDFIANRLSSNIRQTALVSVGTTTTMSRVDSSTCSRVAIGFKVSLWRGRTTSDYVNWRRAADSALGRLNLSYTGILRALQKKDSIYTAFMKTAADTAKPPAVRVKSGNAAMEYSRQTLEPKASRDLKAKTDSASTGYINRLAKSTNFVRIGWKLDLAGGFVFDFPSNTFSNGRTSKASLWLTGGYDNPRKISLLGTLRLSSDYYTSVLNDSGQVVRFLNTNILNADAGIKLIYNFSEKCYLSGEAIVRNAFLPDKKRFTDNHVSYPANTNRWTLALNYNVAKNQNVCFTFGKNFDNRLENKKNLIAFLTYIAGIGASRPVQ